MSQNDHPDDDWGLDTPSVLRGMLWATVVSVVFWAVVVGVYLWAW